MGEIGDHCRGFLGGASDKEPACQHRGHKIHEFNPWRIELGGSPGGEHGNPL